MPCLISGLIAVDGVRQYQCRFCPKFCTYMHNLKQHDMTLIYIVWSSCDLFALKAVIDIIYILIFKYFFINYTFLRVLGIGSASRGTNGNKKKYKCSYCGKETSKAGNLATHMRVHTGEKPYQCDVCGKRFSQLSNKKSHMVVHLNF